MELLLIVAALVALAVASVAWGADSRDPIGPDGRHRPTWPGAPREREGRREERFDAPRRLAADAAAPQPCVGRQAQAAPLTRAAQPVALDETPSRV